MIWLFIILVVLLTNRWFWELIALIWVKIGKLLKPSTQNPS